MSCNCCEAPPCPGPTIQSKGISNTGGKTPPPTPCGYQVGGVYYSTYTWSQIGTAEGGFGPACDYTADYSATLTKTKTLIGGVCQETSSWSGSSSYTMTGEHCSSYKESCTATMTPDGNWTGTVTPENENDPPYPISGSPCGGSYGSIEENYDGEVTPEEGESTGAMIARVTSGLPDYPEDWGGGGGAASRNLSPDESSYSVSRFKWRLAHSPTGTCYLKVWLRRAFYPEGEEEPEYTALSPYTWSASGEPCLDNPDRSPGHEDNLVTGSEATVTEPSQDGSVSIEVVKWSCVPGYEPPDDGSANGYPPVMGEEE